MAFFSGTKPTEEIVVPKPPRPTALESGAFRDAAGTLGIEVGAQDLTKKQRNIMRKLNLPKFQPVLERLQESFDDPRGIFGISTEGLTGKQRDLLRRLQIKPQFQPVLDLLRGTGEVEGGGAISDLQRQRALEEEQLGIQRGFVGPAGDLQQAILQRLLETFTPEGLRGQAGLVGQAFQEPFRQAEEELIAQFQNQGFDPFGTTPGAQALGQFGASKASLIADAILRNLQFSSELGIRPVTPFVPGFQGQPLPSTGLGIGLGQAQTGLGGTLGQIRMAGFQPQILGRAGQGPKAPGVFGAGGALIGGGIGAFLGGPVGAAVGAGIGGIGGAGLGAGLSRG